MNKCPYCGGTIGRVCFNPQECGEITRQVELSSQFEAGAAWFQTMAVQSLREQASKIESVSAAQYCLDWAEYISGLPYKQPLPEPAGSKPDQSVDLSGLLMSASNKPVDPRVEVVARAIMRGFTGSASHPMWDEARGEAAEIIHALDEYEVSKADG